MSEATTSVVLDALHLYGNELGLTQSRQQQLLGDFMMVRSFFAGRTATISHADGRIEVVQNPLSFAEFLEGYRPWVDPAAPCRVETAVKSHCANGKEWPVKDRLALLAVAIDAMLLNEQQGGVMPISFRDFVGNIATAVKAGAYTLPVLSGAAKRARKQAAKVVFEMVDGARAVYTTPVRGDVAGHVKKGFGDSWQFQLDDGELLLDIEAANCRAPDELTPPVPDISADVTSSLVFPHASEWNQKMLVREPLADAPIGQDLDMREVDFGAVKMRLTLKNGETGPYVDPELRDAESGEVLADANPREHSVLGYYIIKHDGARYKTEVVLEAQEVQHVQGGSPKPQEAVP